MKKAAIAIGLLTLTVGCIGGWLFIGAMAHIYRHRFGIEYLPAYTQLCVSLRPYLLAVPLPFAVIPIILPFRRGLTAEFALLYMTLVTFVLTFLAFALAIAAWIVWWPPDSL